MLVKRPSGVTQHDTLPWHTRLAATIEVMRKEGLAISTQIEGENNHARYRLHTAGTLHTSKGEAVTLTAKGDEA